MLDVDRHGDLHHLADYGGWQRDLRGNASEIIVRNREIRLLANANHAMTATGCFITLIGNAVDIHICARARGHLASVVESILIAVDLGADEERQRRALILVNESVTINVGDGAGFVRRDVGAAEVGDQRNVVAAINCSITVNIELNAPERIEKTHNACACGVGKQVVGAAGIAGFTAVARNGELNRRGKVSISRGTIMKHRRTIAQIPQRRCLHLEATRVAVGNAVADACGFHVAHVMEQKIGVGSEGLISQRGFKRGRVGSRETRGVAGRTANRIEDCFARHARLWTLRRRGEIALKEGDRVDELKTVAAGRIFGLGDVVASIECALVATRSGFVTDDSIGDSHFRAASVGRKRKDRGDLRLPTESASSQRRTRSGFKRLHHVHAARDTIAVVVVGISVG